MLIYHFFLRFAHFSWKPSGKQTEWFYDCFEYSSSHSSQSVCNYDLIRSDCNCGLISELTTFNVTNFRWKVLNVILDCTLLEIYAKVQSILARKTYPVDANFDFPLFPPPPLLPTLIPPPYNHSNHININSTSVVVMERDDRGTTLHNSTQQYFSLSFHPPSTSTLLLPTVLILDSNSD